MLLGFLSLVKRNSKLLISLVFVIIIAAFLYLVWDYGNISSEVDNLTESNTRLTNQITSFKNEVNRQTQLIQELRASNAEIDSKYNSAVQKLSNLSSMTDKEIEDNRPKIDSQINLDYNEFQKELLCSTGDLSKC